MQIVLNQKDADFIANFVRNLMLTLDQNFKTVSDNMTSRVDSCQKLAEVFEVQEDERIKQLNQELADASDKAIKAMQDEYNVKREELEKVLMLVMTGSEDL